MKRINFLLLIVTLMISAQTGEACTAAVISGKATPDGRPILWKNRDTSNEQNCIQYFGGGKYAFVAVVNSDSESPKSIWAGANTSGFSIMNTLSYNLKTNKKEGESGGSRNGVLMKQALAVCATVDDFKNFLDTVARPRIVEANFGVIDAQGGAAFFEVDDSTYVMFDANDAKTAPFGYIVRTNFSFSGKKDVGFGHIRYQEAERLLFDASASGAITPEWIFSDLTRSFSNPMLGIDLKSGRYNKPHTSGWFVEHDFIARKKSTSAIAIQGVLPNENPDLTTLWTSIGYPSVTPAVPVWVKGADKKLPRLLVRDKESKVSPLCNAALQIRNKIYSYKRGSDSEKYFNWELLHNASGTGYLQLANTEEKKIFAKATVVLNGWRKEGKVDVSQAHKFYDETDKFQFTVISEQSSVISEQSPAISEQLSAISHKLSMINLQLMNK